MRLIVPLQGVVQGRGGFIVPLRPSSCGYKPLNRRNEGDNVGLSPPLRASSRRRDDGPDTGSAGEIGLQKERWAISKRKKKEVRENRTVMAELETTKKRKQMADKSGSNWPSIKPKKNLQIHSLKDTDLFTVQNFLTPAESRALVKVAESAGFAHQGSLGPLRGEAYRDNDRISFNDSLLADSIWASGLSQLFSDKRIRGKIAVGLNPNIRFYRYKVGQRFGKHIDESVHLGEGKRTHYTLLIYLSGGSVTKGKNDTKSLKDSSSEPLVGGETVFYGSRNSVVAEVTPMEGMALFHIHGDKCMLHEALNVTKGVKYVFRSDVVFA